VELEDSIPFAGFRGEALLTPLEEFLEDFGDALV
jgi:hypothetical protein